jgi:hypothetical protein
MLAPNVYLDGLSTRRRMRSRLDEEGLRKLAVLELALHTVSRLTRRDRDLLRALMRTGNATAAARGRARTYASRRTHHVILPSAEALIELLRLYLDGDFEVALRCLGEVHRPRGAAP